MGGFSQYTQPEERRSKFPFIVGAAVIVVIVGVVLALNRGGTGTPSPGLVVYAENLQLSDLHMSTAQNFVGGTVTYLEGKVANRGDKAVTGATVEAVFRNSLGETVDRQSQPLRVAAAPLGHPDWVALSTAPLYPNQSVEFRLTFEHISADWNQGFPELRFTAVTTR